jgi:N-acetylneuraminic acid mutarotase
MSSTRRRFQARFRRLSDTALVPAKHRLRRPLAAGSFSLALLAANGCGGGGHSATHASSGPRAGAAVASVQLVSTSTLPSPVQLPAVAAVSGGVLAIGGLDSSEASSAQLVRVDRSGARATGQLPVALHDASAATIEGQAYYFGGGGAAGASAQILRVSESGGSVAGQLPAGASDVASATVGGTAYVVGGYTEVVPLRTIVAFSPAGGARVAGMLPVPLRYAAVAAVDGRVLIAGGTSGETAQRAILSFDPASGQVRQIGELPQPLTHGAGAALAGSFLVFGGRGSLKTSQRSDILAIDPLTGVVRRAGTLPKPMSDIGAASLPGEVVLIGGRDSAGAVQGEALTYAPGG